MRELRRLFFKEDGAAAIEFAFVVIPFLISILFIMELCRVIYVMSSVDLILSESSSATVTLKNSTDSEKYFESVVNEMSKGWALLLTGENLKIKTKIVYCQTIAQLASNQCSSNTASPTASSTATLGVYTLTVPYEPLFFVFPSSLIQKTMVRKIVLVQEHNLDR